VRRPPHHSCQMQQQPLLHRPSGVPADDIAWPIVQDPKRAWAQRRPVSALLMVDMSTAHLLGLAFLSPLLPSQHSHAVVRSSGLLCRQQQLTRLAHACLR
jgi:hypothetical protein